MLLIVIITSFMIGQSYARSTIPASTFSVSKLSAPQPLSAPQSVSIARNANVPSNLTASDATRSSAIDPQYLIKNLNADLQVKDTRKVADGLQTWITRTDPRATTSGTDYRQVSENLYKVSLIFSVQATFYPQIYRYLRDYTMHNGGRLIAFTESIQDVTSSYIDTQSRLQNLRAEQKRLQELLSNAQAISDIVNIDQQLTNVEGQIESYETQLNSLTSQVTFYTVSVSLEPIETATNDGWSIGQIFHDAFSASLAFGQGVVGLLIWLLAFGFYIMPFTIVVWLGRKWYIRTRRVSLPKIEMEG